MQPSTILQSELIDIVFENRNKSYGAYPLRKYYHQRLYTALLIMCSLGALLAIGLFSYQPTSMVKILEIETILHQLPSVEPLPKKDPLPIPKKPIPATAKKAAAQRTQLFVNRIQLVAPHTATALPFLSDSMAIGSVDEPGIPGKLPMVTPPGAGPVTAALPSPGVAGQAKPLASAEVMPAFPGGMEALQRFLQNNLQTPEVLEPGTTVSVRVKFVVGYNGQLQGFDIIEDGGKEFNKEVIRVLKKMPAWIPGRSGGEKVAVYFSLPVKFSSVE